MVTDKEFNAIRTKLIEITGVDILSLKNEYTALKKYTWKRDGYACIRCSISLVDTRLARHHLIPRRLARYLLGLTRRQIDNPLNTTILCEKCHDKADKEIREFILNNYPHIWNESRREKLTRWWY